MNYDEMLRRRLRPQPAGWLDVLSRLGHFALINYALPRSHLAPFIPAARFEIPEFVIDGEPLALISAVPFLDVDFHFIRLFPRLKWRFAQTNYRAYVIDKASGEHAVWFFGTTLGSPIVEIPRLLWKIPWHGARYALDCQYDQAAGRYDAYRMQIRSPWASARIDLEDSGQPIELERGFASAAEMRFILTHPVAGYFFRRDGRLGTYSVWHDLIRATSGRPRDLYFSLFEELGLLAQDEMQRPHSIFICPETTFKVLLPPRALLEDTRWR